MDLGDLQFTVGDVLKDPAFTGYGRLLFPADRRVTEDMTLEEVSSDSGYVWYSQIQPDKTVEIVNYLKESAESGAPVFYNIYTEDERNCDVTKQDTGLFYFTFALIYRPDFAYEDLAAAITYITEHARELDVDPEEYSL